VAPDRFYTMAGLEQSTENGEGAGSNPAKRIRSGSVDRTRPRCFYPQIAKYCGSGNTDDSANFASTVALAA